MGGTASSTGPGVPGGGRRRPELASRAPRDLDLSGNAITDVSPLLHLGSLANLGLDETDSTRLTGVDQLRAAGISVNGLA